MCSPFFTCVLAWTALVAFAYRSGWCCHIQKSGIVYFWSKSVCTWFNDICTHHSRVFAEQAKQTLQVERDRSDKEKRQPFSAEVAISQDVHLCKKPHIMQVAGFHGFIVQRGHSQGCWCQKVSEEIEDTRWYKMMYWYKERNVRSAGFPWHCTCSCGWFHIRSIRRCLYIAGIPDMLVKDYGPSMAVLQALGDMPLGSLEHDGGVGIPAQKFGLFVARFWDRLLDPPWS